MGVIKGKKGESRQLETGVLLDDRYRQSPARPDNARSSQQRDFWGCLRVSGLGTRRLGEKATRDSARGGESGAATLKIGAATYETGAATLKTGAATP